MQIYHFDYNDKLKDPRWKKRRLEILKRDHFICQRCGHKSKQNEVHHVVYEFGFEPWEYKDEYLITLCRMCHEKETRDSSRLSSLIKNMKLSGFFCSEILNKINLKS